MMKLIVFLSSLIIFGISSAQIINENPFKQISLQSLNYVESIDFQEEVNKTVRLINQFRVENGLQEVELDAKMSDFGQEFISHLLNENQLYHSDLNDGNYTLENLYTEYGFGGFLRLDEEWLSMISTNTFNAWKKSPGHRANMLNPDITKIGFSFQIKTNVSNGNYSYVLDGILIGQ
jgi:uncharacterized protein YkwD